MQTTKQISHYVEDILTDEYYNNLHFIAFTENKILAISPKSKKVHFFYEVNEDLSFHFNLLCEVGAPYQAWFKRMLRDLHYTLEPKETETDYFEIISNWNK